MKEIRPNTGIAEIIEERTEEKIELHASLKERLESILSAFEFSVKEVEDVSPYVLNTDIDAALVTSISMYAFFGLYESKAEIREDFYDDYKKTIEMSSVKNSKEKVSAQKGGARTTELYRRCQNAKLKWKGIKLDCKVLKETMKLRVMAAQTRSANSRTENQTPWVHQQ